MERITKKKAIEIIDNDEDGTELIETFEVDNPVVLVNEK